MAANRRPNVGTNTSEIREQFLSYCIILLKNSLDNESTGIRQIDR
jgi:hypothetical protein